MEARNRIKKVVKWLIGEGYANSQKEVGRLLGYANESAFSQVINGHVDLPADFMSRLSSLDDRLNIVWLQFGEGEMLKSAPAGSTKTDKVAASDMEIGSALRIMEKQMEQLERQTEQMDRLIAQLEQWSSRYDRVSDRLDHLSEAVSVSFRPFEGIRTNLDIQNPPPIKPDATR